MLPSPLNMISTSSHSSLIRWSLIALLLFTLIIAPFVLFEAFFNHQISALHAALSHGLGLSVLVVGALMLDVFLPIPSSVVNTWAGTELGLWQGTLAAWLGLSTGSLLAYEIARWFGDTALRRFVGEDSFQRAQVLHQRYGLAALALMRPVPVLAEASVFWAGMVGIQRRYFALIVLPANLGIAFTYALVGAYAATDWNTFLLAFAFALVLPGIAMLAARKVLPVAAQPQEASADRQHFAINYGYPVSYTQDVFAPSNGTLLDVVGENTVACRMCVCIDQGVLDAWPDLTRRIQDYAEQHADRIQLADILPVPGGETCKSDPQVLATLYQHLQTNRVDRHSYVLAIGGGGVLDAVGYAAATAHRGIRLIRLPTTVLAQDDAGIGVKNGINLAGQKNYLGTFAPPHAVINDALFLDTLSERDKRAGMAEAVKVALIRDAGFFGWLEANADALKNFQADALAYLIRRCAELHLRQITSGGDPFEHGSARPLDYGHWAAHRLETLSDYALRHGEAVAIGIALDTRYSVLSGHLAAGKEERVCKLLEKLGFTLWHTALISCDTQGKSALLQGLREFQEHLGGRLTISLLTDLGDELPVHEMDEQKILACVDWLQQRHKQA